MRKFYKITFTSLIAAILLLFSTGLFAEDNTAPSPEEQATLDATAFIVDEENNSITYIKPSETTDEEVNVYEKFDDVSKDAWYERYLSHLVQLGIIHGIDENAFAPNSNVTRAQFATMLAIASKADLSAYQGVTSFQDVAADAWYAPQVEWAFRQNLIYGRAAGLFCPEEYTTREEAAVLLDRYAVANDGPVLEMNDYELTENAREYISEENANILSALLQNSESIDANNVSSWAKDNVERMWDVGIFCGDENGKFNPQDYLKRSECVKILSAYTFLTQNRPFISREEVILSI